MQKLLSMYQLWLDDLFPRAKFADGLAMVEKLGHSKRMQMMRREWIEQGKPKAQDAEPEGNEEAHKDDANQTGSGSVEYPESGPSIQPNESTSQLPGDGGVEGSSGGNVRSKSPVGDLLDTAEEPEDDELDALLAESANRDTAPTGANSLFDEGVATAAGTQASGQRDEFADDMEAMAEMDGMW